MIFKTTLKSVALAFCLATSVSSISSPSEEAIAAVALEARAKTLRNVTDVAGRGLPGNGADCSMFYDSDWGGYGWTGFNLHLWGEWMQDGGKGFHDNVQGQCGSQLEWNWEWYDDGSGHVEFQVADEKPNCCVQNAVWLASDPTGAIGGVECCWDTYPWCSTVNSC